MRHCGVFYHSMVYVVLWYRTFSCCGCCLFDFYLLLCSVCLSLHTGESVKWRKKKTPLRVDWPAAPSPRSWSGHCGRIPRSDTRGLYLRNDEGQEGFFPVTEGNLSSLRSHLTSAASLDHKITACCVNHDDVCVHISLPLLLASPASLYDYPALLIYRL